MKQVKNKVINTIMENKKSNRKENVILINYMTGHEKYIHGHEI